MKTLKLTLLLVATTFSLSAKEVYTTNAFDSGTTPIGRAVDYHVTDDNPFKSGTVIDLTHEDAWVYLENMRPSVFLDNHIGKVKINGASLDSANCRVNIYKHGTVIIPHDSAYVALKLYTKRDFQGETLELPIGGPYRFNEEEYKKFNNTAVSFELKRGYMATLANDADGAGYSRVFIADTADIKVDLLQPELVNKVSFVRVFRWQWPSKKGWDSSGRMWQNENELTQATWFYSWSADKATYPDYEYVPIRQKKYWPSWNEINGKENVTHLLGHNEPDKSDQSNLTVEEVIEEWPYMMESGLRLGSPALASNIGWLRNFIAECDKRNYRVDFVAIHAYWDLRDGQNASPQKWYNSLKSWYEAGGKRPIWITEWNNGANWTGGSFPNDTLGQNEKQLADIKKILQVLDTCSFVERYSIYNWVEDKRAMVRGTITQEQIDNSQTGNNPISQDRLGEKSATGWGDQYLTPAGVYYRNNLPELAFNPKNEVVPTYNMVAPEQDLAAAFDHLTRKVKLTWTDYNGENSGYYTLNCKENEERFKEIHKAPTPQVKNSYELEYDNKESVNYSYRVDISSGSTVYSTNVATVDIGAIKGADSIRWGRLNVSDMVTKSFYYNRRYADVPAVFFSGYSYNNGRANLSYKLTDISQKSFRFAVTPWNYAADNTVYDTPEDASFIVAAFGNYTWGDLPVEIGTVKDLKGDWVDVKFAKPFDEVPVVFVTTAESKLNFPVSPRVKDVTKEGFKVRLTRERDITIRFSPEDLNYFAIQPGETTVNGKKLKVGTVENVGEVSNSVTIDFGAEFSDPFYMGALQTSNDDLTSTLRFRDLTSTGVETFKQQERSSGAGQAALDMLGWIVIEGEPDIVEDEDPSSGLDNYSGENLFTVYPTITSGDLNVLLPDGTVLFIYNMMGNQVKVTEVNNQYLDVNDLPDGIYIIKNGNGAVQRFIKVN